MARWMAGWWINSGWWMDRGMNGCMDGWVDG